MITIKKLDQNTQASDLGACVSCGRWYVDVQMHRLIISNDRGGSILGASLCICEDCLYQLYSLADKVLESGIGSL